MLCMGTADTLHKVTDCIWISLPRTYVHLSTHIFCPFLQKRAHTVRLLSPHLSAPVFSGLGALCGLFHFPSSLSHVVTSVLTEGNSEGWTVGHACCP